MNDDAIPLNVYLTSGVENYTDMLVFVLEIINIPNDKSKGYYHRRDFVRNLLANLLISWRVGLPVMYSRRMCKWSVSSRYAKLFMKYEIMVEVIDLFLEYGFIDHTMGHWSNNDQKGKVSRITPAKNLIQIFQEFDMGDVDYLSKDKPNEVIHLKDDDKNLILYKDTRKIRRMRASLEKYNDYIQDQSVQISCENLPLSDKHIETIMSAVRMGMISNLYISQAGGGEHSSISLQNLEHNTYLHTYTYTTTDTTGKIFYYDLSMSLDYLYLHRVFNRRVFRLGGRFYGSVHQVLSKGLRHHITINDTPTIELDYSALHPRMLYHLIGIDYKDDIYKVLCDSPEDRAYLKLIVMVSINCPRNKSIEWSVQRGIRGRNNGMKMVSREKIVGYVKRFKEYHQPIARFIHSGIGLNLQYKDSIIMNNILKRGVKNDIPMLPVHDSVIVPAQHRDFLEQVMNEEYEKIMGFKPIIK